MVILNENIVGREVSFYENKGTVLACWINNYGRMVVAIVDRRGVTYEKEYIEIELPEFNRSILTDEELSYVKANPIEAIKSVRERLGLTLKEAKELVDKFR